MAPVELRLLVKLSPCCGCDRDKELLGRAQGCRKVQNRLKVLHSSLPSALLSTPTSTFLQGAKACSLSLPAPRRFLWEAKQYLNFPAWQENLYLLSFVGSYHSNISCQVFFPPGHLWEGPHTLRLPSPMKAFPVRRTLFESTWDTMEAFQKVFPISLLLTWKVVVSLPCQSLTTAQWKMLYRYGLLEGIFKLQKKLIDVLESRFIFK